MSLASTRTAVQAARTLLRTLGVVALVLAGACRGPAILIDSEADPAANLSALRTFRWVDPGTVPGLQPTVPAAYVIEQVRVALVNDLSRMGYRAVREEPADFEVTVFLTRERNTQLIPVQTVGAGPNGAVSMTLQNRVTHRARLAIHTFAPDSRALLWRGWATLRLDTDREPILDAAAMIDGILKRFPTR